MGVPEPGQLVVQPVQKDRFVRKVKAAVRRDLTDADRHGTVVKQTVAAQDRMSTVTPPVAGRTPMFERVI